MEKFVKDIREFTVCTSGSANPLGIILFGVSGWIFLTLLSFHLGPAFKMGLLLGYDIWMVQEARIDMKPIVSILGEFILIWFCFYVRVPLFLLVAEKIYLMKDMLTWWNSSGAEFLFILSQLLQIALCLWKLSLWATREFASTTRV